MPDRSLIFPVFQSVAVPAVPNGPGFAVAVHRFRQPPTECVVAILGPAALADIGLERHYPDQAVQSIVIEPQLAAIGTAGQAAIAPDVIVINSAGAVADPVIAPLANFGNLGFRVRRVGFEKIEIGIVQIGPYAFPPLRQLAPGQLGGGIRQPVAGRIEPPLPLAVGPGHGDQAP